MSSAREKDKECTCQNRLLLDNLDQVTDMIRKKDFPKDKRFEVWIKNEPYCFLEYIDSEDRWYLFVKSIEIQEDENNNWSSHTLEVSDIKESS